MKIIPDFNIRGFMLTAAFFAGLGFGISAFALEHAYLIDLNSKTATELDTLGGNDSDASGINDAGEVAGFSNTAGGAYHAFITGHDGMGTRDLAPWAMGAMLLTSTMPGRWRVGLARLTALMLPTLSSPAPTGWA